MNGTADPMDDYLLVHFNRSHECLHRSLMGILIAFLFGVANFALHKAVLESGHPLLGQVPWFYHLLGGRFSLVVEFVMLLGALLMISTGSVGWAWGYAVYSLFNGLSAWMILSRRI